MIKLAYVPPYKEMLEYYGHPDGDGDGAPDKKWLDERTELYDLPFTLVGCWDNRMYNRLRFHVLAGPAIVDALEEIALKMGPAKVMKYNELGGAICVRPMTGSTWLSTHATGSAIDLNPTIAPWQGDPGGQPREIVNAFESRGFTWGGRWASPYRDGHHFDGVGAR